TLGRLNAVNYPTVSGRALRFAASYHYDQRGVADAVCNAEHASNAPPIACDPDANPIWRASHRQADGQLLTESFANGEAATRAYADPRGFLTKIETKLGATKNQSLEYGYD